MTICRVSKNIIHRVVIGFKLWTRVYIRQETCWPLEVTLFRHAPGLTWISKFGSDQTSGVIPNFDNFVRTTSGKDHFFVQNLFGWPSGLLTYILGSSLMYIGFNIIDTAFCPSKPVHMMADRSEYKSISNPSAYSEYLEFSHVCSQKKKKKFPSTFAKFSFSAVTMVGTQTKTILCIPT